MCGLCVTVQRSLRLGAIVQTGDVLNESGTLEGSAVRTLWICGLLSFLSIVAYSHVAVTLSAAAKSEFETKKSSSITAPPPLLNTPIGAIARNTSSGKPAPGSTRPDSPLTADLAMYVFWHRTRDDAVSAATTEKLGGCSE
jgi:hypothetical protein